MGVALLRGTAVQPWFTLFFLYEFFFFIKISGFYSNIYRSVNETLTVTLIMKLLPAIPITVLC